MKKEVWRFVLLGVLVLLGVVGVVLVLLDEDIYLSPGSTAEINDEGFSLQIEISEGDFVPGFKASVFDDAGEVIGECFASGLKTFGVMTVDFNCDDDISNAKSGEYFVCANKGCRKLREEVPIGFVFPQEEEGILGVVGELEEEVSEGVVLEEVVEEEISEIELTEVEKAAVRQASIEFVESDRMLIGIFDPVLEGAVAEENVGKIKAITSEVRGLEQHLILSACRIAYNQGRTELVNKLVQEVENPGWRDTCRFGLIYWH